MNGRFPYETKRERSDGLPPARVMASSTVADDSRGRPGRTRVAISDFLRLIGCFCLGLIDIAAVAIVIVSVLGFLLLGIVCTVR